MIRSKFDQVYMHTKTFSIHFVKHYILAARFHITAGRKQVSWCVQFITKYHKVKKVNDTEIIGTVSFDGNTVLFLLFTEVPPGAIPSAPLKALIVCLKDRSNWFALLEIDSYFINKRGRENYHCSPLSW